MPSKQVETDCLPHWDVSNVFPSLESAEFSSAFDDLKSNLDGIDDYIDKHKIAGGTTPAMNTDQLAEVIRGYLDLTNAAIRIHATLNAYVYSFAATDSYNTTAQRLRSEVQMLGVRLQKQGIRFQSWVGGIEDKLDEIIENDDTVAEHSFLLKELAEQSVYLMSDAEESLAAELGLSGEVAWEKLQSTVCSQLVVPFDYRGKTENVPITGLQNIRRSDPDPEVRQRAYETELKAWESVREPLASAMNGVKGSAGTLASRRGRRDALHSALDASRIDQDTLDTMLGVMRESFPTFRRYLKNKAGRLGKTELPWWDLFAAVGKSDRRFKYSEATEFVLEHFSGFSDRLVSFARRAFDNNWIDAEPRDGKTGGAFCTGLPMVEESRVLCNFDGSLDQIMTLAHELGHAFHNECKAQREILQRITPMTLAETASIFCETIVTDAILKDASSEEEELAILEAFLVSATQVVVDISSRFIFEKEVFERRRSSELSADDFCEIMLKAQKETYGDGLDQRYLHPYMWAWKPHYYLSNMSYYNYPYSFGMLFGFGLYGIYKERGESFIPEYEALLSSTGMGTAADLAGKFGIDIRQPEFWKTSMGIIESRIQRYTEL